MTNENITSKKYLSLKSDYPDFISCVESLGKTVKSVGPLDEKTILLAQIAAAATIRSEGSVHSHTRRALESGISASEIKHCLLSLTSTIGFPTVVAAISWAEDIILD